MKLSDTMVEALRFYSDDHEREAVAFPKSNTRVALIRRGLLTTGLNAWDHKLTADGWAFLRSGQTMDEAHAEALALNFATCSGVESRYKFLRLIDGEIMSDHGDAVWSVGEWQSVEGVVKLCYNGFHCSRRMYEAFSYVQGEIVAKVEVAGDFVMCSDKEAWGSQRIVDARLWRKEDSVALAVYAAELVLGSFESKFPDDHRPRRAIEAAVRWINTPTQSAYAADAAAYAADAARAASAAYAAHAARSAHAAHAAHAARAADAAAYAADAAAYAADAAHAAYAASAAAYAAHAASSADADGGVKIISTISHWMETRFDTLPIFEQKTGDGS